MDDTSAPAGTPADTDHEQGLLKEWDNNENTETRSPRRPVDHWRRWSTPAWMSFLILMMLMFSVGAYIVADFSSYPNSAMEMGYPDGSHTTEESSGHTPVGDEVLTHGQEGHQAGVHETQEDHSTSEDASNATSDADGEVHVIRTNDYVLDRDWDFFAPPQRRTYNWTVRDQEYNPDGVYRPMILVNSEFPGPLIEANEGDTIVVHVDNQAVNATAIHWHGLYQNSTPHMDGTVGITQCPIAPGASFTYEFTVSGQSGTYWWHSHVGVQSSDGLHGPLVIHSKAEKNLQPIRYDTDRVLLISDHYHDLSSALLWQYLLPDMENAEPVPLGGLINGRNIRNCDDFPERKCDNTSAHVGMPRLDLQKSQSHRLRLINVGAFAEFQFQIDGHELAVTEVDGTDVEPVSYHRVNINPAQRYSVVVDANGADLVWMRARMIKTCFTDPPKTLEPDVLGIVRYVQSPAKRDDDGHDDDGDDDGDDDDKDNDDKDDDDQDDDDKDKDDDGKDDDDGSDDDDDDRDQKSGGEERLPTSVDWKEMLDLECRDMNTTELRPLRPVEAPAQPDAFFYLRSNFEIGAYRLARGKFNQTIWKPDIRSPSLQRTVDGLRSGNQTFQAAAVDTPAFVNSAAFDISRELVIQTTGIQVVDIVVSNFDDGNHPIHLHGYKYFVLAQGHGYPPLTHVGADITQANLAPLYDSLDLSNPLRRDTASVEAFGWIMIRVVADNPGAWALHCHVSWHTEAGLLMQLITRTDELSKFDVPSSNHELCAAGGIEKGSGPSDEELSEFAR